MAETRKDKRAPVSLKVRFKSATVDEFIEQYCRDVSRGGIFIKSSQPMPIGTLLKFQLQLKDESSLIKGVGRVVWTRSEDDASSEAPAGMGIKFIKMDGDSRVVVDRIVGAQGGGPGAYDQGEPAGLPSDAPPAGDAAGGGGFFPNLPAPVLPPPEDRTAVRHAAQFLASALSEGGTDQAASREAEEKAAEAVRRTAQIEAERLAEAERLKEERQKKEALAAAEGLPSMIIDPSLSIPPPPDAAEAAPVRIPTAARAPISERPTAAQRERPKPVRSTAPPEEVDTSITDRQRAEAAALQVAIAEAKARRRHSIMTRVLVIGAVMLVAAVLALRNEKETQPTGELVLHEPAKEPPAVVAATPAPEPTGEPTPAPELAAEPTPALEPSAEPAPTAAPNAEPSGAASPTPTPAQPVNMRKVRVSTAPEGAEIFVGEESRGHAPITLELPDGERVSVRAKSAGRSEAIEEVTVGETTSPLKLTLAPLPYVLRIETTPPGAVVFVGSKRGTSPVDIVVGSAPKGPVTVTARLPGHGTEVVTVAASAFRELENAMRASVEVTLTPNAPAPGPEPELEPAPEEPKPIATPTPKPPKPKPKPRPVAKPVGPAPAKPPKPDTEQHNDPIPDNPFG